LSTIDGEAPAFNRRSTNSVFPVITALAKNVFFYYVDNKTEFLIHRSLQFECHLKQKNKISDMTCCILF
jgi:hypothetical protein